MAAQYAIWRERAKGHAAARHGGDGGEQRRVGRRRAIPSICLARHVAETRTTATRLLLALPGWLAGWLLQWCAAAAVAVSAERHRDARR